MSPKMRTMCGWKPVIVFAAMFAMLFSGSAFAAGAEKVKIIYTSYLDFLMDLPIAIEKGYFKTLGLDVETVDIASGPTRNSLLAQDEMNGAFLPSETALTLVDKGLTMVMVSGIGNRTFDFAVLAKSPVKSLKDFEGKTIAIVPKPSNPRLALEYDLDQNHIKANLITTTTDADRLSMLLSGRVDIIFSSPPTEARLGDELRVVHTATTSKYLWNSCGWWFKPDFISKHPEAVRKFVQGLAKARQVIIEDPAEAIRVYSKYNKLKDDSYKKPFVLPQFDNPPVIYAYGLERTYKIMKEYQMLKKEIDTSTLIDGRFAKSLVAPY